MEKPKRNIKLTIAYDGTHYLGWQKTKMGPSIEETLQASLEIIYQHPIELQAASRTDAGVHADGQVVNFFTNKKTPSLDKLKWSLNGLLPKDIVVKAAEDACIEFHPTIDCEGKEYRYQLCYDTIQMPKERLYVWHYPCDLNLELMEKAAVLLAGEHDYSAFCNYKKNANYAHKIRRVDQITIKQLSHKHLLFSVKGNNFLYKMVRNLVGTLVYVGAGKIDIKDISQILKAKKRLLAGVTAPAHGLTLHQLNYL